MPSNAQIVDLSATAPVSENVVSGTDGESPTPPPAQPSTSSAHSPDEKIGIETARSPSPINELFEKGQNLFKSVEDLVRDRPLATFGVSFAVGWVIALATKKKDAKK